MSEFVIEDVSNVPEDARQKTPNFTAAFRGLPLGKAIFVPCKNGEEPSVVVNRHRNSAGRGAGPGIKVRSRGDRERKGAWFWKEAVPS